MKLLYVRRWLWRLKQTPRRLFLLRSELLAEVVIIAAHLISENAIAARRSYHLLSSLPLPRSLLPLRCRGAAFCFHVSEH